MRSLVFLRTVQVSVIQLNYPFRSRYENTWDDLSVAVDRGRDSLILFMDAARAPSGG